MVDIVRTFPSTVSAKNLNFEDYKQELQIPTQGSNCHGLENTGKGRAVYGSLFGCILPKHCHAEVFVFIFGCGDTTWLEARVYMHHAYIIHQGMIQTMETFMEPKKCLISWRAYNSNFFVKNWIRVLSILCLLFSFQHESAQLSLLVLSTRSTHQANINYWKNLVATLTRFFLLMFGKPYVLISSSTVNTFTAEHATLRDLMVIMCAMWSSLLSRKPSFEPWPSATTS